MLDCNVAVTAFRQHYGASPRLFIAPGRVNLIGEHTDYNDGFVLPVAIERETVVAALARSDRLVEVRSLAQPDDVLIFDLDRPGPKTRGVWLDYVEGMAQAVEARGVRLTGANLVIDSDVPAGSGLSSSAALEISTGLALVAMAGAQLAAKDLALAGQAAEHTYVGTLCGIMDQYIAALGRADHALLIDCRSLDAELVPFDLSDARLVVFDTRVKHALATSAYNTRRAECERGVALLRALARPENASLRALRDVSVRAFARDEESLPEPVRRRCRHVVTENERTLLAAAALRAGDLAAVGRLMLASHRSLRDDYEVSAPELDVIVDTAAALPGVYGARMTGGGFGGCAIVLAEADAARAVEDHVTRAMQTKFGKDPYVFSTRARGGAREV